MKCYLQKRAADLKDRKERAKGLSKGVRSQRIRTLENNTQLQVHVKGDMNKVHSEHKEQIHLRKTQNRKESTEKHTSA